MDHLLHCKPHSYDHLKLRAQQQQASAKAAILKIKHDIHGFIRKHAGRLARALADARSALLDLLNTKLGAKLRRKIKNRRSQEPYSGGGGDGGATPMQHLSLLHDGAVLSLADQEPSEAAGGLGYYYDSSWNAVLPVEQLPPMIAGYLEWPEEDGMEEDEDEEGGGCNEIDRLAEKFIARCRERFVLEKQESYRRFQEMLARSL